MKVLPNACKVHASQYDIFRRKVTSRSCYGHQSVSLYKCTSCSSIVLYTLHWHMLIIPRFICSEQVVASLWPSELACCQFSCDWEGRWEGKGGSLKVLLWVWQCVHTHTHTHTHTHMSASMHTHMHNTHAHTHTHMPACMHTHKHTHSCTYTCMDTHTHTHIAVITCNHCAHTSLTT